MGLTTQLLIDRTAIGTSKTVNEDSFTATAGQTEFVLTWPVAHEVEIVFEINGTAQSTDDYSWDPTTKTITWSGTALTAGQTVDIYQGLIVTARDADESGTLQVEISGGTTATTVQLQGRTTEDAPWSLIAEVDAGTGDSGTTGSNAINDSIIIVVAIMPHMRAEITAVGGSPTVNAWLQE